MTQKPLSRGDLVKLLEQAMQDDMPREVIERLQWFLHFAQKQSVSSTCRQFGIARTTFYRWFKRFDPSDLSSLTNQPLLKTSSIRERFKEEVQETALTSFPFLSKRTATLITVLFLLNLTFLAFAIPTIAFGASSWNPTLLVNTEAFQTIDDDDTASNVELRFGDTWSEKLFYNISANQFEFTRSLNVHGNISGTGSLSIQKNMSGASLRVDDSADIWGNLAVSGTTTVDGAAKVRGNLSGETLRVDSNADIWGTLGVSGATVID